MGGLIETLAAGDHHDRRLLNARTGATVASHVAVAFDSASRRRGLLDRTTFEPGDGMVIAPCEGIHTWFMRFPIDVAFVTRDGVVLSVRHALRPWRLAMSLRAFAVVELPPGQLQRADIRPGDTLSAA